MSVEIFDCCKANISLFTLFKSLWRKKKFKEVTSGKFFGKDF